MKIGLSYSRCVRDIVEGRVDMADVLVIVARTDFDPHNDEQWAGIWQGYAGGNTRGSMIRMFGGTNPEWANTDHTEQEFRAVSRDLWDFGKLHQPRKFGAHPRRLPYYWLETVLPESELERNPAVQDAWNQFQVIAGLAGVKIDGQAE